MRAALFCFLMLHAVDELVVCVLPSVGEESPKTAL